MLANILPRVLFFIEPIPKADVQSTLQYVLGQNLVKEREEILEMLMSDERNENGRFDDEDLSKYTS